MKKRELILVFAGNTMIFGCPADKEAEITGTLKSVLENAMEGRYCITTMPGPISTATWSSQHLIGFYFRDEIPYYSQEMVSNQKAMLDLLKKEASKGEDWKGDEE